MRLLSPWASSARWVVGTIYRLCPGLHRAVRSAALCAAAAWAPFAAPAQALPDPWLARLRAESGLAVLQEDARLTEAARRHAEDLAARGELSHVGTGGVSLLDRWRAVGGTSLRVGEILGAGESLPEVETAWEESPPHRAVILDPLWTHAGWARVPRGGAAVYVVLFSRIAVRDLAASWEGGRFAVRGAFLSPEARFPVLVSGMEILEPDSWDHESLRFAFLVPRSLFEPYMRLGYRTDSGTLVLTDALRPAGEGATLPGP